MKGFLRALAPPFATFVLLTVAAELLLRLFRVPGWLVPTPSVVFRAAAEAGAQLGGAAVTTAGAAVGGFLLAAIIGVVAAIVLSSSLLLERALYPWTVFFQTVPIVAVAPLLVLWFGAGTRAVTVSAFIVSVFPVVANTLAGLRSTDPALLDLFRLHGAGRLATLRKLRLPAALPAIFTGLRVAAGLAVIGAVVGEFVAGFAEGNAGLGILILEANRRLRTDLLFAAVLAASLLGLALFGAVRLAGHLVLRGWHTSESEGGAGGS